MVGTHDNNPIALWAESMINTHEGYLHAKNLVEDLFADADNKDDIIVKLTQDAGFLTFVKIVEIFEGWIKENNPHNKKQCKFDLGYEFDKNNIIVTIKIPYKTKGR